MQLKNAEQVAEQLQVSRFRIYEMARLGLIPSVRLGRQIRFDPRIIDEWIARGGSSGKEQFDWLLDNKQTKMGGIYD